MGAELRGNLEGLLYQVERGVNLLETQVAANQRALAALSQSLQQAWQTHGRGCVQTYVITLTGVDGTPMAGETIVWGPDPSPYTSPVTSGSGVTDGSGVVALTVVDFWENQCDFRLLSPRADPANRIEKFSGAVPCDADYTLPLGFGEHYDEPHYTITNLPIPYPLKDTLLCDVPALGISGLSMTNFVGTATVNFAGCGGGCPAAAGVPVQVTLQVTPGSAFSLVRYDFPSKLVGGVLCPDAAGTNSSSAEYGLGAGHGTAVVTGTGTGATGLTVTVTGDPAGHVGVLFCNGAGPVATFTEV